MKKVITSELIPVKIWTDEVEEGAMVQIKNLANLPFAFKHIAMIVSCETSDLITKVEELK